MKITFFLLYVLLGYSSIGAAQADECLPIEQRQIIRDMITTNRIKYGIRKVGEQKSLPNTYIWPVAPSPTTNAAGVSSICQFVDHDATNGLLDWNCGNRTYNGHRGTDICSTPYPWYMVENEEAHIVSMASGTILWKMDGNDSYSCDFSQPDWNGIGVQHSDGSTAWYGHFKENSLTTKSVGQSVVSGEYLGVMASSGMSTGPHLHIEIYDADDNLVDPYAGTCNGLNSNTSFWQNQPGYYHAGINRVTVQSGPAEYGPDCNSIETPNYLDEVDAGELIHYRLFFSGVLSGTSVDYQLTAPDGSILFALNTAFNSDAFETIRGSIFSIPASAETGNYRLEATYQGVTVDYEFEVVGAAVTCDDGIQNGDEEGIDCGGSNCAPCVSQCADLTITDFTYNAATNRWSVTITNVGDGTATFTNPMAVQAYWSSTPTGMDLPASGFDLAAVTSELLPGASVTFGLNAANGPLANQYLNIIVDRNGTFSECDETNNTSFINLGGSATCNESYDDPILVFEDTEAYSTGSGNFIRYNLDVANNGIYPDMLFVASPDLPACGNNTNASRTWVNIYDASNNGYIYGFCALDQSSSLSNIWFAVAEGECPPEEIYIVLNDRLCDVEYTSNTISLPACSTCNDGIQNGNEEGIDCGGSNCAPCVSQCADLTITDFTYNAATNRWSVTITNVGDGTATFTNPIAVQAYWSSTPTGMDLPASGFDLAAVTSELLPGASVTFGLNAANGPLANQYLNIIVDRNGTFSECDETNNTSFINLGGSATCNESYDDPILVFEDTEAYSTGSGNFIRYNLDVANNGIYPDMLFVASPDLPACGNNTNASRTWVNIYDASNNGYIYGFCALDQSSSLSNIWFAVAEGECPPEEIYIVLND
ncbi:peptidoglycan DD-metalloendopeptidase family protein, partial [Neolewinella aurantiaca]